MTFEDEFLNVLLLMLFSITGASIPINHKVTVFILVLLFLLDPVELKSSSCRGQSFSLFYFQVTLDS